MNTRGEDRKFYFSIGYWRGGVPKIREVYGGGLEMLPLDKRGLKNVLLQDSFSTVLPTIFCECSLTVNRQITLNLTVKKTYF